MKIKRLKLKKVLGWLLVTSLLLLLFTALLTYHIKRSTEAFIFDNSDNLPEAYTVLVLGASVFSDGKLSTMLKDRVDSALLLYEDGKVKRFLLSGDNRNTNYNEPIAMKKYLISRDVPEKDIFMDFAGFDTYDSVYRASYIFEVDKAIVVSQGFHLPRAIYIARSMDLEFYGYIGDRRDYVFVARNRFREMVANVKAWGELLVDKEPHFKGDKIPITGKNN